MIDDEEERQVVQITPEAWEAYRSAFRALGPCHAMVDHWRHDLGWHIPESAVLEFLAEERARFVPNGGSLH